MMQRSSPLRSGWLRFISRRSTATRRGVSLRVLPCLRPILRRMRRVGTGFGEGGPGVREAGTGLIAKFCPLREISTASKCGHIASLMNDLDFLI